MGTDKARVTIGGVTLLARVTGVAGLVGDVVVIGGAPAEGLDHVTDLRTGRLGPLAGLEAALFHGAGREVILVGVDQPFVRAETLRRLSEVPGDAVIPIDDGWEQVTCALYREACLPAVRAALDVADDLAIITILDAVATTRVDPDEWGAWGEDGRSWFSVDTPESLTEGIDRFEPPSG